MKVGDQVKVKQSNIASVGSGRHLYWCLLKTHRVIGMMDDKITFDGRTWYYVDDFYLAEWTPKRGEIIEVSDEGKYFLGAEFIAYVDGIEYPYVVLSHGREFAVSFKYARQINPLIAEIAQLEDQIKKLKEKL